MTVQGGARVLAVIAFVVGSTGAVQAQSTKPELPTRGEIMVPPPPPAPIAVAPSYYPYSRPARLKPVPVSVEVLGGGATLYKGDLRIGDSNASYSTTLNEAYDACPADGTGVPRFSNVNSSMRVSISRRDRGPKNVEQFNVSVNWTRPGPACEGGVSNVGFDRTVAIAPGGTVTLTGDAGLTVRVTRGQ